MNETLLTYCLRENLFYLILNIHDFQMKKNTLRVIASAIITKARFQKDIKDILKYKNL